MKSHLFLILLILWLQPTYTVGQNKAFSEFSTWAKQHANEILKDRGELQFSNDKAFKATIGSARIVAIGEPVHGSHEPLMLRNQLIQYLVKELGFTAITLESGFSTSKKIYDFILGGPGDAKAIAKNNFSYGFGAFKENVDLIKWLRSHNASLPGSQKVRFYGIDLTGGYFPKAYRSIQSVLEYLSNTNPKLFKSLESEMLDVQNQFKFNTYLNLPVTRKDYISAKINDLISSLRYNRIGLIENSSKVEYDWALQQAINAAYDDAFLRHMRPDFDMTFADTSKLAHFESINLREATMAENLEWVLSQEGKKGKIILFAHDGHVQCQPSRYEQHSPFGKMANGRQTVGIYLRSMFEQQMVVIGVHFGNTQGKFPAAALPTDNDKFEVLLGTLGISSYLIDLRSLPKSGSLFDFMSINHPIRSGNSGDVYTFITPKEAYDAIIYLDVISPALTEK